ncbi:unnamed protein product [Cylicostephanus goldi]|uniref:protein-disulfide reductase n=1 Tax=Cylicostephanus goldi TaxID=71465 RepID=A0A3P6S4E1_CYLGO|nr:unnamed protein product [Cylicostephanus goldi]
MEEAHGDWYCLPFGSPKIQELATKYGVSGIPALIIIKADGKEVTKNGRGDVTFDFCRRIAQESLQNWRFQSKNPKAALSAWKSA